MARKEISLFLFLLFSFSLLPTNLISNDLNETKEGWAISASKNWHLSSPILSQETKLSPYDPLIPSPYGEFDPLIENPPVPNLDLFPSSTLSIIQLSSNNGTHIFDLSEEYEFKIVDRISTNVWMIKYTLNSEVDQLGEDSRVRWLEYLPLGWKLHPSLNQIGEVEKISVLAVISSELMESEKKDLYDDLLQKKIDVITCGFTDCIISLDFRTTYQLEKLLVDDRIIWIEPSYSYVLTNAQAGEQSGIQSILDNWNSGLNGTGEVVSIVDTGLDIDHSDFANQVIAIENSFGLDNDAADSISGHGTHVAGTLLGDGSGELEAKGIAPEATLQMYQLEHNQQGVIARIGSIYDLMEDAYDNQARFQSTSWVSENAGGQYNGDSQSADRFLWENRDFIAIYSAGNNGSNGMNTVAAPSTSKNAISVGASTDSLEPSVASYSGQGPTFDGRIKPDIVAPGENICSSRAEEAMSSIGTDCTNSFHSDGTTPLHTSLSGASQATPVVSGAAVLTRQFLREELGLSSPGSDLIKAILVHGADDLGTLNVPNELEGWGKLNLENSLYPVYSGTELNTWYDDSQVLQPGRMFIYAYELDSSNGLDVTLAWNDEDVSSSSFQTSSKLLNDLDIVVIAPNGTTYFGNDFSNGFSTVGGSPDNLNNLERIRINPNSASSSGVWQIQVHHRAGSVQPFSLVVSGFGDEEPSSDLSIVPDSLWISESTPMVNSGVLVRGTWANQANLLTNSYDVKILDLTTGDVILSETRSPLSGGQIDSIQIPYTFTVTGNHDLQLVIDDGNAVNELNEDNNVFNLSLIVAAEGILLDLINGDGSIKNSRDFHLDPFNDTSIDLNFRLDHQGTENENVQFSVLSIRAVDQDNPLYTLQTSDSWGYSTNLSADENDDAIVLMTPDGTSGSVVDFTLSLENLDADLSGPTKFYPSAEIIIVEVVSSYINNPLVTDSLEFTVNITPIADVEVVIAGTGLETGPPGEWVKFSQGIRNIGNSPAIFELSCTTESNWEVRVGRDSYSNVYELEKMNQGEQLTTEVMVRVPKVMNGLPSLNQREEVFCNVVDLDGTIEGYETSMNISVGQLESFETIMRDSSGENIEPSFSNPSIVVKPSEEVILSLDIENKGNIDLNLEITVEGTESDWNYEIYLFEDGSSIDDFFSVGIASSVKIMVAILVPTNAEIGTFNDLEIKIKLTTFSYTLNSTRLVLDELPDLEVIEYEQPCIAISGKDSVCSIIIQNTGNVDLILDWPISSELNNDGVEIALPEGWSAFLSNTPGIIKPSEKKTINLYLQTNWSILINSEQSVVIKAKSELPSGEVFLSNLELNVIVKPSTIIDLKLVDSNGIVLENSNLFDLGAGSEAQIYIRASNLGNTDGFLAISFQILEGWNVVCSEENLLISSGENIILSCVLKVPQNGGPLIEINSEFNVSNNLEECIFEINVLTLRASSSEVELTNSGLFGFSKGNQVIVILVLFGVLILAAMRFKKTKRIEEPSSNSDDLPSSDERLELMLKAEEYDSGVISGGVDKSEIEAALNQSKPTLPTLPGMPNLPAPVNIPNLPSIPELPKPPSAKVFGPPPIPPEGIPAGWTMEQWIHYGHQWLNKKNK